jgi:hypothetical protein
MAKNLGLFLILLALALPIWGDESSALINKALDSRVPKLKVDDELPRAMQAITDQTGVRIKEDPIIWDLLPWGQQTNIRINVDNATLRDALLAITQKLGLTFQLRDEYVELLPMPGLRRLAQRAGRDELKALEILSSRQLGMENTRPTIKQLLDAVDEKLAAEKEVQFAIENRTAESVRQETIVFVPRNATLMDALESLPKETKATWYPWGKSIVIVTKDERTRRLLAKPLTFHGGERGLDVTQTLSDLAQQCGVQIDFQPGAIQTLPADARVLKGANGRPAVLENVPAQQILEIISAATGLAYVVQDDKVEITNPNAAPGVGPRDRAIGLLQLDIGMQVLVPTSEVPPDLREYIKYKTQKELAKVRQMMEDEKWTPPTTQPAKGQ